MRGKFTGVARLQSLLSFLQDVRCRLRQLPRRAGFNTVAVLTLGLGIGANTAVLSVIDPMLFKPLPVSAPRQLVDVYGFKPDERLEGGPMSYPDYQDLREEAKSLTGLAAVTAPQLAALNREGESHLDPAQLVTSNSFDVLGVKPSLEHTFEAARARRT